jgi:integrase
VVGPAQAEAILTEISRIRPELTAFFGCLYYGALRPEEAVALTAECCDLPPSGWGTLTLTTTAVQRDRVDRRRH